MGTLIINNGVTLTQVSPPDPALFFLDAYPGSNAAYSISRRLSSTYTGPLIRIKDVDTATETDIGYDVNGSLDTAAILSAVSGGTAYIMSMYDQSSNGNTASSAGTYPMYIVRGGVIDTSGGIPGAFTSTNQAHFTVSSSITSKTVLSVYQQTTIGNIAYVGFSSSPTNGIWAGGSAVGGIDGAGFFDGTNIFDSGEGEDLLRHISFWSLDGSGGGKVGVDGNAINTFTGSLINNFTFSDVFGRNQNALSMIGYRHEWISYSTDESANYAGMISEMQNFY